MELKLLNPDQLRLAYETDLREAFPPEELKPLSTMEELERRGLYDALALFGEEGEGPLGYALLWKHEDPRFLLIDYLCVPAGRRNGGIGARLLAALIDRYPEDTVLIGESEAPTGQAGADEMILRRLAFYRRNGAVTLGYDTALFGVHFKTIAWSRGPLPPEGEILQKHREIYENLFAGSPLEEMIQIPLAPGEAPRPRTKWTEGGSHADSSL